MAALAPMKIAMIGAGSYARAHLNALKHMDVEVVGHVSPTAASREAAAERYGGRAYASCQTLLEREEVDAAWISVPPYAHGEIEAALIEGDIPFFVEKPLSADLVTAERIAEMIARKNLVVGVGYKFRAMSALDEVRARLQEHPPQLVLAAWHGATPDVAWWRRQALSGGQIVEQATHLVDLARYLLGEATVLSATARRHPREAYPDLDVATASTGTLAFASGAIGLVSATCLNALRDVYLRLVCEDMSIIIRPERIIFETPQGKQEIEVRDDLVALEDRAFIQAVRQRDASLVLSCYEDALLTHKLCVAMSEMAVQL